MAAKKPGSNLGKKRSRMSWQWQGNGTRRWAWLIPLLLLTTFQASPARTQPAAEWSQLGGNSAHDGSSLRVPVRSSPREAWRVELPGELIGDPVTWGGILYFILERSGGRKLHAIHIATGKSAAHARNLSGGKWTDLSVANGIVVVGEPEGIQGLTLRGKSFSRSWSKTIKRRGLGPPVLHDQTIYAAAGGKLYSFDCKNGRSIGSVGGFGAKGFLGVGPAGKAGDMHVVGVSIEPVPKEKKKNDVLPPLRLALYRAPLSALAKKRSGVSEAEHIVLTRLPPGSPQDAPLLGMISLSHEGNSNIGWYIENRIPSEKIAFSSRMLNQQDRMRPSKLITRTATRQSLAHGFDENGDLTTLGGKGGGRIVEKQRLPTGALPGPATLCGDVLYLGNWALEASTRRVLWCLPELTPASPLIPVADHRFVVTTHDGSLICFTDLDPMEIPPIAESSTSTKQPAGPPDPPPFPKATNGVLLASGEQIRGSAIILKDRIRIHPETDPILEVARDEVAMIEKDGKVIFAGEELNSLNLWQDAIRLSHARSLDDLFQEYLGKKLIRQCRALITEARAYGLSKSRAHHLERALAGKTEHSSAEAIYKRLQPKEEEARKKAFANYLQGSKWCQERGLLSAATCLLSDAGKVWPSGPSLKEEIGSCIPASFPFKDDPEPETLWARWAKELVLSGGRFLDPEDTQWHRLADPRDRRRRPVIRRSKIWTKETLGLQTGSLVCFSLERTPEVVGACLRYGEGAIRALRYYFEETEHGSTSKGEPLEMRIHGIRDTYIKEMGNRPVEWSAGYYTSLEKVSRFFIPRSRDGKVADTSLYRVVAHELTHHFIDQRVIVRKKELEFTKFGSNGYWIVEGVARFVEHQASDSVRTGLSFDDPTVQSLDVTTQVHKAGKHFIPHELVEMTQPRFSELDTKSMLTVRLRHSFRNYNVSPLVLFYEQSAALAFFMLNRRGPEGRAAFNNYLQDYYTGRLQPESWTLLGFETREDLDQAFLGFLASDKRGG